MNPYYYDNDEVQAELQPAAGRAKHWFRYSVHFPSTYQTHHEELNTVEGVYYCPRQAGTIPLVILVHGMGDQSVIPCQFLARHLARMGMATFVLYLPFHSSHMPETMKKRLPNLNPEEWFELYRVSVINLRQVVDWAGSRTELDNKRVAAFGISLGGFVSAIAMGVDKRIKAGVFTVTAGNSEKMMRLSKAETYRTGYQRSDDEYNQIQKTYTEYLAEVAEKGFENVDAARPSFLTDPMTFAPYLMGRPILMINALWDKYIPREAVLDLWQACGRPGIKWFPAGHGSIWLWYPVIRRHITRFLSSAFGLTGASVE